MESNVTVHYLGPFHSTCQFCHALHWAAEPVSVDGYGDCCLHGKVSVPFVATLPTDLYRLYCSLDDDATEFRSHICRYNKAFAFTSTGGPGRVDGSMFDGRGPPCYKIQGELYHQISAIAPDDGRAPLYSQLYICDNSDALHRRHHNNPDTSFRTMMLLQTVMMEHNPFVAVYEQAKELCLTATLPAYRLCLDFLRATDHRRYNLPHANYELVAIIPGDVDACIACREIIVQPKGGPLIRISECHPAYTPLHFLLLAPTGQLGWNTEMRYLPQPNSRGSTHTHLTLRNYLQFRLHCRPASVESDHYFRSGFLLQEYIVETWLAAEHCHLRWIRDHQADLRAELYTGLIDALNEGLHASAVGRKVVLPSSFTSSPCFMHIKSCKTR